jgi:hypothetical protein
MTHLIIVAAWKVLLASVILGAGLPAIFALGIRALAIGQPVTAGSGDEAGGETLGSPKPIGIALAAICFLIVLYVIVMGILFIVVSGQGNTVGFSHGYPQITDK